MRNLQVDLAGVGRCMRAENRTCARRDRCHGQHVSMSAPPLGRTTVPTSRPSTGCTA